MPIRTLSRLLLALSLLLAPSSAQEDGCGFGVPFTWTGLGGTNNWNNPDNWIPTVIPGECDDVTITPGVAQPYITGTVRAGVLRILPEAVVTVDNLGSVLIDGDIDLFWDVEAAKVGVLEILPGGTVSVEGKWIQANNTSLPELGGTVSFTGNNTIETDTFVRFDNVFVAPGATLTLPPEEIQIHGDFTVASGATVLGSGFLTFVGGASKSNTDASTISNVRVKSGTLEPNGTLSVAGDFVLDPGATLSMNTNRKLEVGGNASFSGTVLASSLDFGSAEIDVEGNVLADGTLSFLDPQKSDLDFDCAGNWTSVASFDGLPENFRFKFDGSGPSQIQGSVRMAELIVDQNSAATLVSGSFDMVDVQVRENGTLNMNGNEIVFRGEYDADDDNCTTNGPGTLRFIGGGFSSCFDTEDNSVPDLVVESGLIVIERTTLASLTQLGGTIEHDGFDDITVQGDVKLLGGTYTFDGFGQTNNDLLDIAGDLIVDGGGFDPTFTDQARVRIAGDLVAQNALTIPDGLFEFVGGPSSVSGPAPDLPHVEILEGGLTLTSATTSAQGVLVEADTTLDVGAHTLRFAGDFDADAPGANVTGSGLLEFDFPGGSGSLLGGVNPLPALSVIDGELIAFGSTVASLTQTGGTLRVREPQILAVSGDAQLLGGVLSSFGSGIGDTGLDVEGDLVLNGGSFAPGNLANYVLRCAGDFSELAPFGMPGALDEVELDGGPATIFGPVAFPELVVSGGPKTVQGADLSCTGLSLAANAELDLAGFALDFAGDLDASASGAQISGAGQLRYAAPGETHTFDTAGNPVGELVVLDGRLDVFDALVAGLIQEGGEIVLRNSITLSVAADARMNGGTLTYNSFGSITPTLDVAGDLFLDGGQFQSGPGKAFVLRCAGDWNESVDFGLFDAARRVELVGGPANLSGQPGFADLLVAGGPKTLAASSARAESVTVEESQILDLGSGALRFAGSLDTTAANAALVGGELTFDGIGLVATLRGGSNALPRLRMLNDALRVEDATVAELVIEGGSLQLTNNHTLAVQGDASFTGGALSKFGLGSGVPVLDVEGDMSMEGGVFVPGFESDYVIRCAGDWNELQPFQLTSGIDRVELDGAGPTRLRGAPVFPDLFVTQGVRLLDTPQILQADLVRRSSPISS